MESFSLTRFAFEMRRPGHGDGLMSPSLTRRISETAMPLLTEATIYQLLDVGPHVVAAGDLFQLREGVVPHLALALGDREGDGQVLDQVLVGVLQLVAETLA